MANYDVNTQLDNLQGFLEGLGGGKSSESTENTIFDQIKDFAGEHLNTENLLSMLGQLKSLIKENVTQENLNSLVQTIKSTYNNNQESIKNGLGNVLGAIKSVDKTGKVTGFIECLQNDINDPNCAKQILGPSTLDQSESMALVNKVQFIYSNDNDANLIYIYITWNLYLYKIYHKPIFFCIF